MTRTPEETADWIITEVITDAARKQEIAHAIRHAILEERTACSKVCKWIGLSYDNEGNRKLGVARDLIETAEECAEAILDRVSP
jgi:hypothetical protein